MIAEAVILEGEKKLSKADLRLVAPKTDQLVVKTLFSGISTGTEKLLWESTMPPFPGMRYPLVPGYECFGEIIETNRNSAFSTGDHVFVPGANCYEEVAGLFGGASEYLVTDADRAIKLDGGFAAQGALLALAATAYHAINARGAHAPDLIIGHGVLGRMLARIAIALGMPAPTVWEVDPTRRFGASDYPVIDPSGDQRADYTSVYDASGTNGILGTLMPHLAKGAEVALVGFYTQPISFAFPPAFLKELRLRVAAEWERADLKAIRRMVEDGRLSLDGLITHEHCASDPQVAYQTAFEDPQCLKMILNWERPS